MRIRAFLLVGAVVIGAAGCGSGEEAVPPNQDDKPTTTAAAGPDLSKVEFADFTATKSVKVVARDNTFVAKYIEVAAGTAITFTNEGEQPHNVKPTAAGEFKAIDTADFQPGDSDTITFTKPGDYAYYCSLHGTTAKGMVGAIRVLE